MRYLRIGIAVVTLLVSGLISQAAAQVSMTTGDVERLQQTVFDIGGDIARLRPGDARLADTLQGELDSLREEVIYLKVKLRKEGSVPRSEYSDVRDRLEALRARARGEGGGTPTTAAPPPPVGEAGEGGAFAPSAGVVPVGTEIDARLQTALSSATAQAEDRFEATALVDLTSGGQVLIPAGSVLRGVVTSVNKAGRLDRTGSLTLSFDQITIRSRAYPIRGTVTEAFKSEGYRGDAGKIAAGATVGAILGGILGGGKGVLAGILVGAGGTVAATPGKDVEIAPGTVVRLRFDSPLSLR
jgi:hypothetical protein